MKIVIEENPDLENLSIDTEGNPEDVLSSLVSTFIAMVQRHGRSKKEAFEIFKQVSENIEEMEIKDKE